ncbi:hypothetical protein PR048_012403 [Dryococelus australis]|uniref:Uncharacterized protein n=1 Tax=Dryococelus australis TaxID=614101 RepID=A0ABQ9HPZ0_9NEOP|nr:hypothetical protein PR048_012403 [Dryococelus australis]
MRQAQHALPVVSEPTGLMSSFVASMSAMAKFSIAPEDEGFYAHEHGLDKNPEVKARYETFIATGHMRLVNESSHHAGKKFRVPRLVFTVDIKKMYHQIMILPQHRSYQCIYWRKYKDDPVKIYQLNTVIYGLSAAVFKMPPFVEALLSSTRHVATDNIQGDDNPIIKLEGHNLILNVLLSLDRGRCNDVNQYTVQENDETHSNTEVVPKLTDVVSMDGTPKYDNVSGVRSTPGGATDMQQLTGEVRKIPNTLNKTFNVQFTTFREVPSEPKTLPLNLNLFHSPPIEMEVIPAMVAEIPMLPHLPNVKDVITSMNTTQCTQMSLNPQLSETQEIMPESTASTEGTGKRDKIPNTRTLASYMRKREENIYGETNWRDTRKGTKVFTLFSHLNAAVPVGTMINDQPVGRHNITQLTFYEKPEESSLENIKSDKFYGVLDRAIATRATNFTENSLTEQPHNKHFLLQTAITIGEECQITCTAHRRCKLANKRGGKLIVGCDTSGGTFNYGGCVTNYRLINQFESLAPTYDRLMQLVPEAWWYGSLQVVQSILFIPFSGHETWLQKVVSSVQQASHLYSSPSVLLASSLHPWHRWQNDACNFSWMCRLATRNKVSDYQNGNWFVRCASSFGATCHTRDCFSRCTVDSTLLTPGSRIWSRLLHTLPRYPVQDLVLLDDIPKQCACAPGNKRIQILERKASPGDGRNRGRQSVSSKYACRHCKRYSRIQLKEPASPPLDEFLVVRTLPFYPQQSRTGGCRMVCLNRMDS